MNYRDFGGTFLLASLISLSASNAHAAEFFLRAEAVPVTMPDGREVAMWGYALDADGDFTTLDGFATVPGPRLVVPPGDATLVVHLFNRLGEPTSLVIPGQPLTPSPTFVEPDGATFTGARPPGNVTARVRSFTAETAPGTTGHYTFTQLRPGTYLYESGTHPAVQVQMGLFGALTHDAAAGEAYPGVAYDAEQLLVFSEIDPAFHQAVGSGNFGAGKGVTSPIEFHPKYFLINGAPYTASTLPLSAGTVGQRVLLRMVNAGIQSNAPLLQGGYFSLIAEGGSPGPLHPQRYVAHLPAGSTVDALFTPTTAGRYPLYDRRFHLTNATASPGGMLRFLDVAPAPAPAALEPVR